MREEAPVGMSRAVTTRGGTRRPLRLEGLPVEGRAVQETLLLSAGCQRAPVGAAVGGVLPTDVAQAVAAWHRASFGGRGKQGKKEKMGAGMERRCSEADGGSAFKPCSGTENGGRQKQREQGLDEKNQMI